MWGVFNIFTKNSRMTLKQLISLKFILYLTVTIGMCCMTFDAVDYYRELENNNKMLLKQNELYERLAKLTPNNTKDLMIIKLELKLYSKIPIHNDSTENDYDRLYWLLVYVWLSIGILRFIDEKIEKKKTEVKDLGEML